MSLPMKDAENLVAKEERLLHMFVFRMAPETNAFNKTTLINYFILAVVPSQAMRMKL